MRFKNTVSPWWLIFILFIAFAWKISEYHLNPDYRVLSQAQRQYWAHIPINADRGTIQDREGNILALSVPASSYYIDPKDWEPSDAKELIGIFPASVINNISKKHKGRFVWVEREVSPQIAEKLAEKKLKGFFELNEKLRYYPNNSLMAQTLGFCDIDDNGLEGIESAWDTTLFEPAGYRFSARRRLGKFKSGLNLEKGIPSVVLTLDAKIQFIVEKALNEAVTANAARWGAAVCMDPNTGEVFAMASWPTFNPNGDRSNNAAKFNNAVSYNYEPGSTLKPVIMSIALENGHVGINEIFKCPATIKVADGSISEAYKGTSFGNLSPSGILVKSSNVGMAQIGKRVKPDQMYQALLNWGFGSAPGVELPAPVVEKGILADSSAWKGVTPANIAIGQGLSVTPMQLITALSAIVNGGHLLKPYLIKSASDAEGNVTYTGERTVLRDVITPATSAWLRSVMLETTLNGTGRAANSALVKIGTKTGTAQVPEKGKYGGKYVASIVGFWPFDNPQYIALVVIGEPSKGKYYGGEIASPPLKMIVEEMLDLSPVVVMKGGAAK